MKNLKFIILTLFSGLIFTACSSDDSEDFKESTTQVTENVNESSKKFEVENFLYRGMSDIYLYKRDVPVLADNYFNTTADKNAYFAQFSTPTKLFDKLTSSQDRFSYIMEDYRENNKSSAGSTMTNGMSYGLVSYCNSCNEVFGYVRFVFPNSSASEKGVKRGMIFNRVNGQQLNKSNFQSLLASGTYSIGLAKIENNNISNQDQSISLTSRQQARNPVVMTKTLDVIGKKVGYIFYESFDQDYDEELNNAFGTLKAAGVSDLILDLRYNGGGSVRTATDLAAMITGQFADKIFMKEKWNEKYQAYYESRDPESLLNKFNTKIRTGANINSLNLNRVFVLTSSSTASASELIINGLDPYIEVIHIGDVTTGKFQASVALYDSPNFSKENSELNRNHHYAIQPLVLKSHNANNVSDYVNGLTPDVSAKEDVLNLGPLGDENEILFKVALDAIKGNRNSVPQVKEYNAVGESEMFKENYKEMYIDSRPLPVINN